VVLIQSNVLHYLSKKKKCFALSFACRLSIKTKKAFQNMLENKREEKSPSLTW
jgi:hypothetical protein